MAAWRGWRRAGWAALALAAMAVAAAGVEFRRVSSYTLAPGESQDQELWLAADELDLAGTVRGDVFAMATKARLGGALARDVWCTAVDLKAGGQVAGHARLLGQSVEVESEIGGNLMAAGTTVDVKPAAEIAGDVVLVGETVLFQGGAGGSVTLLGAQVTLGGMIEGPVRLIADDIVVLPGTIIRGDLVYTSTQDLVLDPKVQLGGELRRRVWEPAAAAPAPPWPQVALVQMFFLGAMLLAALFSFHVAPGLMLRSTQLLAMSAWRCVLVGVLVFFLAPLVAVFLMLTLIGLPLGLLILGVYVALLYLAKCGVAVLVGGLLLRRVFRIERTLVYSALALGLMGIYLLYSIPAVSVVVWAVVTLPGLGALTLVLWQGRSPAGPPRVAGGAGLAEQKNMNNEREGT